MKNYIDSNIFINAFIYEGVKAEKCRRIVSDVVQGKIKGVTSVLTWDEIVYSIKKLLDAENAEISGNKFLNAPKLVLAPADRNVVLKSQYLLAKYNLLPRDAIHAATAILNDCDKIISDDSDFDNIKEIKRIGV